MDLETPYTEEDIKLLLNAKDPEERQQQLDYLFQKFLDWEEEKEQE